MDLLYEGCDFTNTEVYIFGGKFCFIVWFFGYFEIRREDDVGFFGYCFVSVNFEFSFFDFLSFYYLYGISFEGFYRSCFELR